MNDKFKKQLLEALNEFSKSKDWWNPGDASLPAFHSWLEHSTKPKQVVVCSNCRFGNRWYNSFYPAKADPDDLCPECGCRTLLT